MEAVNESQHRTIVNLCAGSLAWVNVPSNMTPSIRSWPGSSGGERGDTSPDLTPRDLPRSGPSGRACEANDARPMSWEKSDHLIVATKPGNAGGAKGVTS
jgi:hypothetical protein